MDYKVIYGSCVQDLTRDVQSHLEQGWKLYGFPFGSGGGNAQAVTRPTPRKKPEPPPAKPVATVAAWPYATKIVKGPKTRVAHS